MHVHKCLAILGSVMPVQARSRLSLSSAFAPFGFVPLLFTAKLKIHPDGCLFNLEQVAGIEPASQPWQGCIIATIRYLHFKGPQMRPQDINNFFAKCKVYLTLEEIWRVSFWFSCWLRFWSWRLWLRFWSWRLWRRFWCRRTSSCSFVLVVFLHGKSVTALVVNFD